MYNINNILSREIFLSKFRNISSFEREFRSSIRVSMYGAKSKEAAIRTRDFFARKLQFFRGEVK